MGARIPKALVLAVALRLLGNPAKAAELTQPLTAEEVACNERQRPGASRPSRNAVTPSQL